MEDQRIANKYCFAWCNWSFAKKITMAGSNDISSSSSISNHNSSYSRKGHSPKNITHDADTHLCDAFLSDKHSLLLVKSSA